MTPSDVVVLSMSFASVTMLVLAWLIGVQGMVRLVSNYRAHPERYPDAQGFGRWVGWTLAAGGVSFGLAAIAVAAAAVPFWAAGPWAGATGAFIGIVMLAGIVRYRRVPPPAGKSARRP